MNRINKGVLMLSLIAFSACNHTPQRVQNETTASMKIKKEKFGVAGGQEVFLYTLENQNGMKVKITNYGGIVTSLIVPDREGDFDDVVLGYDSLKGYLRETPYFGAIVGRYANRIARGRFSLDGETFSLAINNGPNHLHGGLRGFDKVVWDAEEVYQEGSAGLRLSYLSPDGEEGYPGNLHVVVTYKLTADNELQIDYEAVTDKPTPVNLTHHSYFNLSGTKGGDILDHELMIDAGSFTEVDEHLIPTGELKNVEGTPFDFRKAFVIKERIEQVAGGYDHNFVLNNKGALAKVAELYDGNSGRIMEVYTTEPGMQFYSGNFLDGTITGKKGIIYHKHAGLCLETQHFPDSPNHPHFPNTILRPGDKYSQRTLYRFGI
jgi:aldose 1-epimerase